MITKSPEHEKHIGHQVNPRLMASLKPCIDTEKTSPSSSVDEISDKLAQIIFDFGSIPAEGNCGLENSLHTACNEICDGDESSANQLIIKTLISLYGKQRVQIEMPSQLRIHNGSKSTARSTRKVCGSSRKISDR